MSNIVKSLTFAEGVSVAAPTQTFMTAGAIGVYASTSAFVTAKGSAAASGDVFLNSTDNSIYEYINSAWRSIGPTMSGATTFTNTTQSTDKDTGALIVEGGVGIEKNLNVGGNLVVTGDFTVNGTTTFVNTTNLDVKDANITLNKGGNQASADDVAGLTVEMSDATHAKLLYDKDATSRWKIGDSGSEVEVVTLSHTQSLSNKTLGNTNTVTLKDSLFTLQNASDTSKQAVFSLASITASNTRTFTLPDANTTLVGIATTQTISNKTNDNTNAYTIKDGSLTLQNTADTSKQAVFSLASISASTTRTFTLPNATTTLVGTDVAQVLTAKDYDGGTASDTSRITVPKDTTANLNALTRKQGTILYDTTLNKLKYDDGTNLNLVGSGSGSGGINYITYNNGDTTTGWTRFLDSGSLPVDGTGGSPSGSVTWNSSSSSPLRDQNSFTLVKDASNRQGEGVSYDFTIDAADKAKMMRVSFDYNIASGTYADDDVIIYFYDITNALPIQPTPYKLKNHSLSSEQFFSEFQTAYNSTSYRMIVYISSTSTSAYTLKFDNFSVGPNAKGYGSTTTDWQSYTPTISGLGTGSTSTNSAQWRRVGDSVEINGFFIKDGSGGSGGAAVMVSLPSGLSIDSAKIGSASYVKFGVLTTNSISSVYSENAIIYGSSNSIAFLKTGTTATILGSDVGAGSNWRYFAKVPILGWSSSQIMSSDASTRVVAAYAHRISSTQTITSGSYQEIVFNTVGKDSHGTFNASNGRYTAPVPGWYRVSYNLSAIMGGTAPSNISAAFYVNGTGGLFGYYYSDTFSSSKTYPLSGTDLVYLNAGDYVSVWVNPTSQNITIDVSGSASNRLSRFSVELISGPSQIASSETVAARYKTSAGNSVANNTQTFIDFGTKDWDYTGSVLGAGGGNVTTTNTGWRFIAPISGLYRVTCCLTLAQTTTWADAEQFGADVRLDGTGVGQLWDDYVHGTASNVSIQKNGSVLVRALAGQRIEIRAVQVSGASLNLEATASSNFVEIERIGNY